MLSSSRTREITQVIGLRVNAIYSEGTMKVAACLARGIGCLVVLFAGTLGHSQAFNMNMDQRSSNWIPCYLGQVPPCDPGGVNAPTNVAVQKVTAPGTASIFTFSVSGSGFSANGTFTATLLSANRYLVNFISATQNGYAMTLLPPGAYAGNNNEVFSSGPALDRAGLAFASNGQKYNVWFNNGTYCNWSNADSCASIAFNLVLPPPPNTLEISLTGPANTNLLVYNKLDSTQATYFSTDFWVYPVITPYVRAYEFDPFAFTSPYEYMFGHQCVVGGVWDVWDQLHIKWVPTATPCTLIQNSWNHVQQWVHYIPGDTGCDEYPCLHFDELGVNNVYYTLNYAEPAGPIPTGWANSSGFQAQLDINGGAPANTTVTEFLQYVDFAELAPEASQVASYCGPVNNYSCADASGDIVQTPATAPFTATTPVNTVIQEPFLSHFHIARVTDMNTANDPCTDNSWNATATGSAAENISNTTGTLVAVSCDGGLSFVLGYNPQTLHSYGFVPGFSCSRLTFSRTNPLLAYCLRGTVVNTVAFAFSSSSTLCGLAAGQCPDITVTPTVAALVDLATCPQASTATPIWKSVLDVGANDSVLTQSLSWTGSQQTARYTFFYTPGYGCTTLDSLGNGTNPIWYNPQGVESILAGVNASFNVHDVTTNGTWAAISAGNCVGSDCNGEIIWQINTDTVDVMSTSAGGHFDFTKSYWVNENNPQVYKRLLTAPNTTTQIGNLQCPSGGAGCTDAHFSGDVNSDTTPVLATTWMLNGPWAVPDRNEVIGIPMDGSTILQFCKTYSSGSSSTGFQGQEAIGAANQPRTVYFFTSDLLLGLGLNSYNSLYRSDVFACGIAGQFSGPAAQSGPTATVN